MTEPNEAADTTADGVFEDVQEEFDVTYWDEDEQPAEELIGEELSDEELRAAFDDDDEDASGDTDLYDLTDSDLDSFQADLESETPEGLRTSSWHLARSLVRLRAEINRKWPHRDKRSDGSLGDRRHSARYSDHNPNGRRSVNAIDIDKDGISPKTVVAAAKKHPATNYVIYNRVIYSRAYGFRARRYRGANPHNHHIHVSVKQNRAAETNTRGWLSSTTVAPKSDFKPKPGNRPKYALAAWPFGSDRSRYFRAYMTGTPPTYKTILGVQRKLYSLGYNIDVDGKYGKAMYSAVVNFQRSNGLRADGLIGYKTYNKLRAKP